MRTRRSLSFGGAGGMERAGIRGRADEPETPLGIPVMPRRGGPIVLRIMVGARLRRLRERSGISAEDAGYAIRASQSKISRMESGRVSFKPRDVADLLTLYGVLDEEERNAVLELVRHANTPAWWHRYGDILPGWREPYLALEESASVIRAYETQGVPDLLQTEDYARAVTRLRRPNASEDEVDGRVDMRMRRRKLLEQPDPPHLWAVVDEAVLRRTVGDDGLMRAQLEHLLDTAHNVPHVTLQILPSTSSRGVFGGIPFRILRFPDFDLPDVVYLEQLTGALYLDKGDDVEAYLTLMDRLCAAALTAEESVAMLGELYAGRGG
ncbi:MULTISPECIES: helix-turn-helix domain-containing protein [Thermomonospora]|uniref:Transcriptional regulator with XRE-family HTH domain n=1 Tax=Thermomonospora cellulosilytica TaxID=1411118 RepID=A0A7W3MYW0_9ACTN|nr:MULTISPECIES: helix-turn-helix transcriptional regulator [Thermomonospora]MBA9004416.1 transcriptional regulator with XRE-family HTH domain [Thermomonospora cellulosilytica]